MSDVTAVRQALAWEPVAPGVLLARDSCNVYALVGPDGVVVVDAGTGAWLDAVDELPAPPVAVLCTHFLRDHSAGALYAAEAGIPVWVPEAEEEIFAEPELHHLQTEALRVAGPGYWHHYAPIEAVPVAGVLRDHDVVKLAGLELEVVPLPGATIGQIGLAVRLPDVGDVVLCGETIHSAGRVPRLAPLQQVILDLDGLYMVYGSLRDLRRRSIDALLPSLGDPIMAQTDAAMAELQDNIRGVAEKRMTAAGMPMAMYLGLFDAPELAKVSDHVYQSDGAVSTKTTFLLSESGKVLCIDYAQALHGLNFLFWNGRAFHRSLLHSLEALEQLTGRPGIDVCLATHYHDDHVGNHAALRRRFGTELWACETFADIVERPQDYALSAAPDPTPVDRRLALEEEFSWEEYRFTMGPKVDGGHTRHQSVFSFEADGLLYAAVGDQFMSRLLWMPTPDHSWENDEFCETYGYRFGQRLAGYRESAEWLLSLRPDVILTGHQIPIHTSELVFQRLGEFVDGFEQMHRSMMPVGDDDVHFDIDSAGALVRPYRVTMPAPGPARFTATVRNPLPHPATLQVRMVGPQRAAGELVEVQAEAHAEVEVELSLDVAGPWRRQAVALELMADGRPFGQVGEALVTVGHDRW